MNLEIEDKVRTTAEYIHISRNDVIGRVIGLCGEIVVEGGRMKLFSVKTWQSDKSVVGIDLFRRNCRVIVVNLDLIISICPSRGPEFWGVGNKIIFPFVDFNFGHSQVRKIILHSQLNNFLGLDKLLEPGKDILPESWWKMINNQIPVDHS